MRTIEQYKKRREQEKRNPKFHIAHLPVGTVVEVEWPASGFINEEARTYPNETYPRKIVTVVNILCNGYNSYLLETTEWQELSKSLSSINIGWVRKIVSRGVGKLNPEDQATVDGLRKRRADYLATQLSSWSDHDDKPTSRQFNSPSNGNRYHISYLAVFLRQYMRERGYMNPLDQHLYDIDQISEFLHTRLTKRYITRPYSPETGFFYGLGGYTVSKKQFAKLFQQAIVKSKRRRRVAAAIEECRQMEQYEREWEHDYDE